MSNDYNLKEKPAKRNAGPLKAARQKIFKI